MQFWPNSDEEYGKVKVTQRFQSEKNGYIAYRFTVVGENTVVTTVSVYVCSMFGVRTIRVFCVLNEPLTDCIKLKLLGA